MLGFLTENLGTIIVGLVVAGVVAAIIIKLVRDKRKGKHIGCDCGCAGCPSSTSCGTKQ